MLLKRYLYLAECLAFHWTYPDAQSAFCTTREGVSICELTHYCRPPPPPELTIYLIPVAGDLIFLTHIDGIGGFL